MSPTEAAPDPAGPAAVSRGEPRNGPAGDSDGAAAAVPARAGRGMRASGGWRNTLREFAIIVAGVLAALGAQALWETYQERELEGAYLRQVLADARENDVRLSEAITQDSISIAAAGQLLAFLERRTAAPPQDTVLAWLNRAGRAPEYQPVFGTLRALLDTGDLRFIRNDALRTGLTRYATALERETERFEQLRGAVLAMVPEMARALPFMRLFFSGRPDEARIDIPALQENTDASVAVFTMQAAAVNRMNGLRRLQQETRHLIGELERYPGLR